MTTLELCAPLTGEQTLQILDLGSAAARRGGKCIPLDDAQTKAYFDGTIAAMGERDYEFAFVAAWVAAWHKTWLETGRLVPAALARLQCEMRGDCTATVTHVEEKGYIYCAEHASSRRISVGHRNRKLERWEIERLCMGLQIHYRLKRLWEYDAKEKERAEAADTLRALAEQKLPQKACDRATPCACGRSDQPHVTPNEKTAYREIARGRFGEDDNIEFDAEPVVTEPSGAGAFVQAWVWVARGDTKLCRDPECDEIVADGGDGYDGYCPRHGDARANVA